MPKIAVVLSGSGVMDGSELHEAVLTLLYLDELGADVQCFAPDKDQMHVIDHVKNQPAENQSRNVMVEAARISRGDIKPLSELNSSDYNALVIPGGFGAAKNLCTFAVKGSDCEVDPDMENAIVGFYTAGKVVAPMCIAPAAVAKALGKKNIKVKLTIGNDTETASAINAMGAEHINCAVDGIVVDVTHKIISTPAYMLGPSIRDVGKGIRKLAEKVIEMSS
ncbi:isoprenoid biosynthesis glyoxalase ElbB [bacterium]|nr:isoprenoid biosynthesis glyoxalase ElbB [bacterium]